MSEERYLFMRGVHAAESKLREINRHNRGLQMLMQIATIKAKEEEAARTGRTVAITPGKVG